MSKVHRFIIIILFSGVSIFAFGQRGDVFRHAISVDAVNFFQGIGNIKYEYFDTPTKGITAHLMADFASKDIPLNGAISRRCYFRNTRWSAFVAPYLSYMQIHGNYTPLVEDEDGNVANGNESLYKTKSANIGLSIGYSYLGYGGFTTSVEFGYGIPVFYQAEWQGDPPTESTKSTLKSIVPLIFNVSLGYAF